MLTGGLDFGISLGGNSDAEAFYSRAVENWNSRRPNGLSLLVKPCRASGRARFLAGHCEWAY